MLIISIISNMTQYTNSCAVVINSRERLCHCGPKTPNMARFRVTAVVFDRISYYAQGFFYFGS